MLNFFDTSIIYLTLNTLCLNAFSSKIIELKFVFSTRIYSFKSSFGFYFQRLAFNFPYNRLKFIKYFFVLLQCLVQRRIKGLSCQFTSSLKGSSRHCAYNKLIIINVFDVHILLNIYYGIFKYIQRLLHMSI